ncbi:hypothetical protein [Lentzea aerocolonigenes]|uniref:hypothetical protein n=1 Tax=Lentzea aerocolonigenes TaxID=68170 RepID=UPI0005EC69E9|nr:hypothetical protein [Lentzea aerocolonigenes]
MGFVFVGWRVATTEPGLVSMSDCVVDLAEETFFNDRAQAERVRAQAPGTHVFAVGFHLVDAPAWRFAEPMPAGDVLGCELVGEDPDGEFWHTWRCLGGLVEDVRDATGVVPGPHGLIQDGEQARRAARWLTASGLGDPKVFNWMAALLVRPRPEA